MKFKPLFLAGLFLLISLTLYSQEKTAGPFGKGILNFVGQDSTWSMKFGMRMQFLSTIRWDKEDGGGLANPSSAMLIRRARLKWDGFAVSPKFVYKIELGLSNRDIAGQSEFTRNAPRYILDAVIKWNFYENFVLWAGQTKLPGNIERVISSGNLHLVDRSIVNALFNIDRDIGFQLRHHTQITDKFLTREIFSFSQGEGRNVVTGNLGGHQYVFRLELLPFGRFTKKGDYLEADIYREQTPKLMFSSSYEINDNAVRTRSNLGNYMFNDVGLYETTIRTLFIDAMFKYRGFSFMGEYANRDAEDPFAKNSDGTLTGDIVQVGDGFNLQSGYLFKSNFEIAGRYSNTDLAENITGVNQVTQYTLGFSRYFVGHKLKVQTDASYFKIDNALDRLFFRLQMDLHF